MMNSPAIDSPATQVSTPDGRKPRRLAPGWFLVSPSVLLLLIWMIVPLGMTVYFSLIATTCCTPAKTIRRPGELRVLRHRRCFPLRRRQYRIAGGQRAADQRGARRADLRPAGGQRVLRPRHRAGAADLAVLHHATVSALLWKNLIFHPVSGILAAIWQFFGAQPVDWLAHYPLFSIIMIVSWQWLPFAILILMTAMQSLDQEQKEAARLDGAGPIAIFWAPDPAAPGAADCGSGDDRTIFLLSVFAEIYTTTSGGPGYESTNLAYLIYNQALLQFDVGMASAGGLIAVVIANIAAIVLIRMIGKNLTDRQ
jgi:sorbitol/mannitol transport system permease protein